MFPKKSFQNPYKTDFLVKKFSPAALTQGLGTLVCKFSQMPKLYHPQILNKVIFSQNLFVVFFSGIRKKNNSFFKIECVYPINYSAEKKTPPLHRCLCGHTWSTLVRYAHTWSLPVRLPYNISSQSWSHSNSVLILDAPHVGHSYLKLTQTPII